MSEENLSRLSEDDMASLSGDEPGFTMDSTPDCEEDQGMAKVEEMLPVVESEIARLEAGYDRHLLELRRRFRANHLKPLHNLRAALLQMIRRRSGQKDRIDGGNLRGAARTDAPNSYHGGGRKEGFRRTRAIRFAPDHDVPSTSRGLVPAIRAAFVPSPSGSMEIKVGDRQADDGSDGSDWESDKRDSSEHEDEGKRRARSMKGEAAARRKRSLRLRRLVRRQQRIRRRIRRSHARNKKSSATLPLAEEGSSSWETLASTDAEGDGSRRQPPVSTRSEPFFHLTRSERGGGSQDEAGSVAATRKSFSESSGVRRRVAPDDPDNHVIPSKRPRLDVSREEAQQATGAERSKSDAAIWRKRLELLARKSRSAGGRSHDFAPTDGTFTAALKDLQLFNAPPPPKKPSSTRLERETPDAKPEAEQDIKSETEATELYASSFNVYQHGIVVAGEGHTTVAETDSSVEAKTEKKKDGQNSVHVEPASSNVGEQQQSKAAASSATKPEEEPKEDDGLHRGSFTTFHHGVFVAPRLSVESESGADADDEATRRNNDRATTTTSSSVARDDEEKDEEERNPARKRKVTAKKVRKVKTGKRRNVVEESESDPTTEEDEMTSLEDSLTTTTESSQSTFYPTDRPAPVRKGTKPRPGPSTQPDALRIVYSNLPGEERVWSRDEASNIQLAFLEARRSSGKKKSKRQGDDGEDWTAEAAKAGGGKRKGKNATPRESGHASGSSLKRKRSEGSAEDLEADSEATEAKRPLLDESLTEIGHCFFAGFWEFIRGDWINEMDDE